MPPRIFYFSRTPLNKRSGATLAMRRHFVEHNDVNVFVASSEEVDEAEYPCLRLKNPPWLARVGRTRLARLVRNYDILVHSQILRREVIEAARKFRPDAVFTVPDLTLSQQALSLSRELGVPLISNFQDWWPQGQFYLDLERPYSSFIPILEQRFRELYRQSDLAFCTSEGMQEFLGSHPNSHVLYPIGAKETSTAEVWEPTVKTGRKKRLLYTGTAFGSYGVMLRALAKRLECSDTWELVIFGARPDWPVAELIHAEACGLYRGFLPFEQLKVELRSADACLSVMSFDPKLEVMMRTSFTTKVLDYCSAGRPIIMWGPDFCSPVRLTKRHGAALTVESPEPDGVIDCLGRLESEHELVESLKQSALALAAKDLSHDTIHSVLISQIQRMLENGRR